MLAVIPLGTEVGEILPNANIFVESTVLSVVLSVQIWEEKTGKIFEPLHIRRKSEYHSHTYNWCPHPKELLL